MSTNAQTGHLAKLLASLGMVPNGIPFVGAISESYIVLLDGKVIGRVADDDAGAFVEKVKLLKVTGKDRVCYLVSFRRSLSLL